MGNDLISVIVPVYNSENTLRRCIESILDQTYKNLEILLIDDGSKDKSGIIADEYAQKDRRIKVYHKKNEGIASTRNFGIDHVTGDWVAFVDSDDWIESTAFETLMQHRKDADICIFGRSNDYPDRNKNFVPSKKYEYIDNQRAIREMIVDAKYAYALWDKIYKRQLFNQIRFPDGHTYEDTRVTYKLILRARIIALIPKVFYHYVQNEGSIVHVLSVSNRLDQWTSMYEHFYVFESYGEEFRIQCLRRCVNSIFNAWRYLWKAEKKELDLEKERIDTIVHFASRHRAEVLRRKDIRIYKKTVFVLASFGGRPSMLFAYLIGRVYDMLRKDDLFNK